LRKDPQQRFAACRAMVDCLLGMPTAGGQQPSSEGRQGAPRGVSDTTSLRSRAAETDAKRPAAATVKTQVSASGEWGRETTQPRGVPAGPLPAPLPEAADLAPIEALSGETHLRPTLFLGIGGTATRTLRHLRRRLRDRLGPAASIPAIQV